jgi:hypothetical protein
LVLLLICQVFVTAETVDWRGPAGSRIKEIRYPKKETKPTPAPVTQAEAAVSTVSNLINSPPEAGFVPWIVLTATNESIDAETTGDYSTYPSGYVGSPPAGITPRTDYFIGIFDTGASAHVIGYENAIQSGIYASYKTQNNFVDVTGVTGSVSAHVTWPYALFMDGLDVLEPNAPGESEMVLPTTSGMVGEYNVATLVGPNPGSNPDLATAIGTPMSVFYDTQIEVDQMITVTHNGIEYTSPKITFYEKGTSEPNYSNYIPLELKPLGATNVQYITYGFNPEDLLDLFSSLNFELDYSPLTPSIVMGTASQNLFFIPGVDMTEGTRTALDKSRFMLDTGAQVTVIGDRIAARLGLRPDNWDFQVDVEGVDGTSKTFPGFYIDSLTIPAVGNWLEFTNVPVVWLEISSPEGGKLDGIIGMNLFTQYNLILRGGGFMLQEDPRLEFQRIQTGPVTGDIAPDPVDGKVNMVDFSLFSQTWMARDTDGNWNPDADFVPTGTSENIIDIEDLTLFAENWLTGIF